MFSQALPLLLLAHTFRFTTALPTPPRTPSSTDDDLAFALALLAPSPSTPNHDLSLPLLESLETLSTTITTLTTTLSAIPPATLLTSPTTTTLSHQTSDITTSLFATLVTATSSAPFNTAQSASISTAADTASSNLLALLANLLAHKHTFAAATLASTVQRDLEEQGDLVKALEEVLREKLTSPHSAVGLLVTGVVAEAFDGGVDELEDCLGATCGSGDGIDGADGAWERFRLDGSQVRVGS